MSNAASSESGKYFRPDSFKLLELAEDTNWWFKTRNSLILWAIRKFASPFENYMELGCGTGFVLRGVRKSFPTARVTGSELFLEGLAVAKRRVPDAVFIQLDATKMKFFGEFDLVGAFDVIEHIDEDELVLRRTHSALTAGGKIAITVPQHMWLWSESDDHALHVRRYAFDDLALKVRASGFEILLQTSFVSLLLPVMALQRRRKKSGDYDPSTEFNIPKLLNLLLTGVMLIELWLIRAGVRFRSGGSILLVAEKR